MVHIPKWKFQNVTRPDPRGFTGMYMSVENDTVAYESWTCVRMHDAWAL
jgi:hypothetical protein